MFCSECGTSVSDINSKFCINCGKPISAISDTPKNDSLNETKEKLFNFAKNVKDLSIKVSEDLKSDETKAKIKDFANQAQSFASEKTKDLKDELNKINEARKETVNETKDFESTSKIENSKAVASSFWSKLTSKQKGILIGSFVLFLILIMQFGDDIDADARKTAELACAINIKKSSLEVDERLKDFSEWNQKMKKKYTNPEELKKYEIAAGGAMMKNVKSCVR